MNSKVRAVMYAAAALLLLQVTQEALAQSRPELTPEQIAALPKWTEMSMSTRDNVKLAANVFLPAGQGPFPVVLSRTPYLKDALGAASGIPAKRYVDAGYAFVVQDVRGKGHSEGFYEAFVNDMADGFDTVEWVAKQPWSNGKVGMVGASALGITSNLAAIAAPGGRLRHRRALRSIVECISRRRVEGCGYARVAEGPRRIAAAISRGQRTRHQFRILERVCDDHAAQIHSHPDV
jgi:dipeptidyl aminopeptidase/acylaminoacyl peptidase